MCGVEQAGSFGTLGQAFDYAPVGRFAQDDTSLPIQN